MVQENPISRYDKAIWSGDNVGQFDTTHFAFLQQNRNAIANNVLARRREQLLNWESSETNSTSSIRKHPSYSKIKFTKVDVFLSACWANDFDEVLDLLNDGADINACTVDGLTALHQAVIDGKSEMVRFLCERGANINVQDNEGWTPLHAASCCGNLGIVEYLCRKGADISVVNNLESLALDLAEVDECRLFLKREHEIQMIGPKECREREHMLMKCHAEEWIRSGELGDHQHPRTGASALHVAASKGYIEVIKLLIVAGVDINCRDWGGWTPLHGAAHWGEEEAAAILIENGASLSELTNVGESVLDVADKDMLEYLKKFINETEVKEKCENESQLTRMDSKASVIRMRSEEKTRKSKLEECKDLCESSYSFTIDGRKTPSVEMRIPCPIAQRDYSSPCNDEDKSLTSPSSSCSDDISLVAERRMSTDKSSEKSPSRFEEEASEAELFSKTRESFSLSSSSPSDPPFSSRSVVSTSRSASSEKQVMESNCTGINEIIDPSSRSQSIDSKQMTSASPTSDTRTTQSVSASSEESLLKASHVVLSESFPKKSSNSHPPPAFQSNVFRKSSPCECKDRNSIHPASVHFKSHSQMLAAPTFVAPVTFESEQNTNNGSLLSTPPPKSNQSKESEAARRSKAKRQRDSRRSTQGVTREQLCAVHSVTHKDEKENDPAGDLDSSYSNLFNQDSVSSIEAWSSEPSNPTNSRKSSSSSLISNIPNILRRSQGTRSVRRGTGPISFEELQSLPDVNCAGRESESSVISSSESPRRCFVTIPSIAPIQSGSKTSQNFKSGGLTMESKSLTHLSSTMEISLPVVSTENSITGSSLIPPFNTIESDYKNLYEFEKLENKRLRQMLLERSVKDASNSHEDAVRVNVCSKSESTINSLLTSSLSDSERRYFERKIAELEYELKQLQHLRNDYQQLKEENRALVRVLSKLSK